MNLDQAIKKIINDHGADILKDRRFVNMLSDFQAFGQLPYAANMLKQIYANGYGTKIHKLYCNQDKTEVAAFLSELRNKLGFDMDMLGKVLYAFSLPVQRAGKQKQVENKQHNISANKSDMDIIKYKGHRAYRDEYGGIYSYPNCEIFYKLEINVQSYSLMNNTKVIYDQAFINCNNLKNIVIPDSITSIGFGAFENCKSLQEITIPNAVTSIGGAAFFECNSLMRISIPDSITNIGEYTFFRCYSLSQVKIPNSVKSIGDSAFCICTSLKKINIPNSITSIGKDAFNSCPALQEITIPNSVTNIEGLAFGFCTSLEKITIPNSVKTIGEDAFFRCDNLRAIYLPHSYSCLSHSDLEKEIGINSYCSVYTTN